MSNAVPQIDSGEMKQSNQLLLAGATLGFVEVQLDVTIVNVAYNKSALHWEAASPDFSGS